MITTRYAAALLAATTLVAAPSLGYGLSPAKTGAGNASTTVGVDELLSCGSFEHGKCPPMDSARANPDTTLAARSLAWLQVNTAAGGPAVNKISAIIGELGATTDCGALVPVATSRQALEERVDLLMAGARLRCKKVQKPLIAVLKSDAKQREKVLAAGGLGIVGDKQGAPALIAALGSEWPRLQASAAQALGVVGGDPAIAPLMRLAGKADVYAPTRAHALAALARLKAVDALPLATALVNATPRKVGRAAFAVIAASPVHWTVPSIAFGLRTPGLRSAAALAAISNPHADLGPIALAAALSADLTPDEREAMLGAIGKIGPVGAATKLLTRIEKADRKELIALMKTLPQLGDRTVVPKLVRYLPHAEPEVAKFVVYALENVTGKRLGMDIPAWHRFAGLDEDGAPSGGRAATP